MESSSDFGEWEELEKEFHSEVQPTPLPCLTCRPEIQDILEQKRAEVESSTGIKLIGLRGRMKATIDSLAKTFGVADELVGSSSGKPLMPNISANSMGELSSILTISRAQVVLVRLKESDVRRGQIDSIGSPKKENLEGKTTEAPSEEPTLCPLKTVKVLKCKKKTEEEVTPTIPAVPELKCAPPVQAPNCLSVNPVQNNPSNGDVCTPRINQCLRKRRTKRRDGATPFQANKMKTIISPLPRIQIPSRDPCLVVAKSPLTPPDQGSKSEVKTKVQVPKALPERLGFFFGRRKRNINWHAIVESK